MIAILWGLSAAALTRNMLVNLRQRRRLSGATTSSQILSELTLCIPARNERSNLSELIPQILALRARPQECLILDDESTDGTRELIEQLCAEHPWIRRVVGVPPENTWRGKVWALEQLKTAAQSPWLLFLDADVRLTSNDSLSALWEQRLESGFVSVFPRITSRFMTSLLTHQIPIHLYYFLPANFESLSMPTAMAGCGQVMLVEKSSLNQLAAFAVLKGSTHDGLKLARLFKALRRPVCFVDGGGFFESQVYENPLAAFRGFTRNSFEATNSLFVTTGIAATLLWVFVTPFILFPFLWVNPVFVIALVYFLYGQWRLSRELELGAAHLAMVPLKALGAAGVHGWGALRSKFGLVTHWHGRQIG